MIRRGRLAFLCMCLSAVSASADSVLIAEVEKLRSSLPSQDLTRQTLTLRLGDLLFDEIGAISRGRDLTAAEQAQVSALQARAIGEYEAAMNGHQGIFKPLTGTLKLKVSFQLARLYTDAGRMGQALPLWNELLAQDQVLELKREAALRLAEYEEQGANYERSGSLYAEAIRLCNGGDVCSYAHYRKSWTLKRQGRLEDAIAAIQSALWDAKGQIREEALRDFIAFLGEKKSDGKAEIAQVEALAEKIGRPKLISDLADAFFSEGNKPAGVYVLSLVDSRSPSLKHKIRLLEEEYGLRHWDSFHRLLAEAKALALSGSRAEDKETEKVLRRLMVQLDGERAAQPEKAGDFQSAVDLHLTLFPGAEDRVKIMEGWLAAETDAERKVAKIHGWLATPVYALSPAAKIGFHETLTALAQKKGDQAAVASEAEALTQLVSDPAKRREYGYVRARALYALKEYGQALPLFLDLAALPAEQASPPKPDKWAILSQNLALDIYGRQKDFAGVERQAGAWTGSAALAALAAQDSDLRSELVEMAAVSEKARFESAAALGQAPGALSIFLDFCATKRLLPRSCENAKVLSVQLKDQAALLKVLQLTGARAELAAEYEAAGYFAEAGEILEKDLPASPAPAASAWVKIALLYELGSRHDARDRILAKILGSVARRKSLGDEEDLLFVTLQDAGLLGVKELDLAWKAENRFRLAERLEDMGKGSAKTRSLLLASPKSTGRAWDELMFAELQRLDHAQRKLNFYGRNSQRKFEGRLGALQKGVAFAEKALAGAGPGLQVRILKLVQASYEELATGIMNTPIPAEVAPEQVAGIQAALAQMAQPFREKAEAYAGLSQKAQPSTDQVVLTQSSPLSSDHGQKEVETAIAGALAALHRNPADVAALTALRDAYAARNSNRLAGYFKGRILQLENGKPSEGRP